MPVPDTSSRSWLPFSKAGGQQSYRQVTSPYCQVVQRKPVSLSAGQASGPLIWDALGSGGCRGDWDDLPSEGTLKPT